MDHVHPRDSRRAVHAIAQAPRYGYECGVTEHHVHNRSGGATSERERVTCAACLDAINTNKVTQPLEEVIP